MKILFFSTEFLQYFFCDPCFYVNCSEVSTVRSRYTVTHVMHATILGMALKKPAKCLFLTKIISGW